jgi:hypothetical protein
MQSFEGPRQDSVLGAGGGGTGSLSAAFLRHPLFSAQWPTVFASRGLVQAFAAARVLVLSVVGTSVAVLHCRSAPWERASAR